MGWGSLGKWIGKGIKWIVRNPEALGAVVKVIKAKKGDKKPPAPVN